MARWNVAHLLLGVFALLGAAVEHKREPLPSTTAEFFDGLDRDGDGQLEAEELRQWIEGSGSVNPAEVSREALARLDRDEDKAVTLGDMKAWFGRLGSVLTVPEAADWVVHAVQLPQEVGEAFRENTITGYDFPDLIKDDGAALVYDLGITRRSFRKRIIKAIELRLLGLGSFPEPPADMAATVVDTGSGALAARISWRRAAADVNANAEVGYKKSAFPVHEYVLQRLDQATDDWETIYCDLGSIFVDGDAAPGRRHTYRLQAWNVIGHSDFVHATVDIPAAFASAAGGSLEWKGGQSSEGGSDRFGASVLGEEPALLPPPQWLEGMHEQQQQRRQRHHSQADGKRGARGGADFRWGEQSAWEFARTAGRAALSLLSWCFYLLNTALVLLGLSVNFLRLSAAFGNGHQGGVERTHVWRFCRAIYGCVRRAAEYIVAVSGAGQPLCAAAFASSNGLTRSNYKRGGADDGSTFVAAAPLYPAAVELSEREAFFALQQQQQQQGGHHKNGHLLGGSGHRGAGGSGDNLAASTVQLPVGSSYGSAYRSRGLSFTSPERRVVSSQQTPQQYQGPRGCYGCKRRRKSLLPRWRKKEYVCRCCTRRFCAKHGVADGENAATSLGREGKKGVRTGICGACLAADASARAGAFTTLASPT